MQTFATKPTPSKYQQDVYDWIRNGSGHAAINAVAGSGKTTTLVESIRFCQETMPGRILYLAFNKHTADTLQERVGSLAKASTFNACGWGICRDNVRGVKLDRYKDEMILKRIVDPFQDRDRFNRLQNPILRMTSLLKSLNRSSSEWEASASEYDVELGDLKPMDRFAEVLAEVYRKSVQDVLVMNFDDQIHAPIFNNWSVPSYTWVLIDEAQDVSPVQIELAKKLAVHGRLILVGDPYQCQPPGSMVSTIDRMGRLSERPIESLKKWDEVVSIQQSNREWRTNKVYEVATRPYDGELIRVTANDGLTSRYTPNHRCLANFSMLRHRWCVYLMRRGSDFRIGKSSMGRAGQQTAGLGARMRAEGATEGWILSIHDTSEEAYTAEQIASVRFNLPQTVFHSGQRGRQTQRWIDEIWTAVGGNMDQAVRCLEAHGRDIRYPLLEGDLRSCGGLNRLMVVRACNLMNECQVIRLDWQPRRKINSIHNRATSEDYREILVTREHYTGPVYSLAVTRDQTYVSDGVATHNSIYSFRGAAPDAMATLTNDLNAKVLPLSVCYRCPSKVIESAKEEVPHIETPDPCLKGNGLVESITTDQFLQKAQGGDFVLCRTTAPLVKRCLQFIREKRKAYVRGRDLGQGLVRLIEKIHGNPTVLKSDYFALYTQKAKPGNADITAFLAQTDEYYAIQAARLVKRGRESELVALDDRITTIQALAEDCDYTAELMKRIEEIFSDEGDADAVTFMTGHRAKGLEADRIFILRPDLFPHPLSKSANAKLQDRNLLYVCKTRAMSELYFVSKERGEK